MDENQTPTKRKYKAHRKKVSAVDNAYNSYSRMWSKTFGKGTARKSKAKFKLEVASHNINLKNKKGLLKLAQQLVATEAHRLTTAQAMRLKEQLLKLKPKALKVLGMTRKDLKSMTIQAYKWLPASDKGMSMLSKFYNVLRISQNLSKSEAGARITSKIYGS